MPIVVPPWALDPSRRGCTTLALLGPARTHFVLHVGPGRGMAGGVYPSNGGAVLATRCGADRFTLLNVLLEMRSPRAVVSALIGLTEEPPPPLAALLPERDSGPAAGLGDPGAEPPRELPAESLRRFERQAASDGASAVREEPLPAERAVVVQLEPGCHRLLTTTPDPGTPYALLIRERENERPERFQSSATGEVSHEVCAARRRPLTLSIEASGVSVERRAALAHFSLPEGLPTRFGSEVTERLATALGGSAAPKRLGLLVSVSMGAQGLTLLPRELLPATCYVAVAIVLHGDARALSLGARAEGWPREANSRPPTKGPRLGFCTGSSGQVDLEVEARGLGVAWLFALFRTGPAAPVPR